MRCNLLCGVILGLFLLAGAALAASEADELREKAKAMKKEAAAMAERGNKEEAAMVQRKAQEMLEAAERIEMKSKGKPDQVGDRDPRQMKERLQELLDRQRRLKEEKASEKELAQVGRQIEELENAIRKTQPPKGDGRDVRPDRPDRPDRLDRPDRPDRRGQAEKLELAQRKIQHLRAAAENLRQADMPDMAEKLTQQAEAMSREVEEARKRLAADTLDGPPQRGEASPEVRELRAEVERLRAELKELQRKDVERKRD